MANEPNKIEKFKELEKDFGTTVSEALWKKAIQTINYLEKSYPVGMLLLMHETQDNLPHPPDSQYWQYCDGSVVSNANSLLNGQTLPDFRDKFFRHIQTGEVFLSAGGSNLVNLGHNHGGFTGYTDARKEFQMDNGGEKAEVNTHRHGIANSFDFTPITPLYIALKVYMRIV